MADRGTFTVTRNARPVAILEPERRLYLVQRRETTEAAIHTTGFADLYAVVGQSEDKGGWIVRLYHQPGVHWIWARSEGRRVGKGGVRTVKSRGRPDHKK